MYIKNQIKEHYKNFFNLNQSAMSEDDELNIDWANDLIKKINIPVVVLGNEQFSLTDVYKMAKGFTEEQFIEMIKHLQI